MLCRPSLQDYAERVLPSIIQDTLSSHVAPLFEGMLCCAAHLSDVMLCCAVPPPPHPTPPQDYAKRVLPSIIQETLSSHVAPLFEGMLCCAAHFF